MSEPNEEPTPVSDINEDVGDDEAVTDMAAVRRLRNEAKRLRHQLREEQENRASDLARIAAYEKREAERAAATVLVDPEDIWRYTDEQTQQSFNDEFGAIVESNVVEVAKRLASERPHLAKPNTAAPPTDRPLEGLRPGARPEESKPAASWYSAIHGS